MKTHLLKDSQNREFYAFQYGMPAEQPLVLVMPGGHCDGQRYDWIGKGLEESGYATLILDAPEECRTTPFNPDKPVKTKIIAIEHAAQLLRHLGLEDRHYISIGHSYGSAVILDDLATGDGAKLKSHTACIILGTHLQSEAFGRKIPGRSDDKPLNKPPGLPILFIAGEHDAMAPPEQVRQTSERYADNTYCLTQQGANHLNWAQGSGWADRPDLDGKATVDPVSQRQTTLNYILAFVQAVSSDSSISETITQAINNDDQFEQHSSNDQHYLSGITA